MLVNSSRFKKLRLAIRVTSSSKESFFSILALSSSCFNSFIVVIFLSSYCYFLALLFNKNNLVVANLALARVIYKRVPNYLFFISLRLVLEKTRNYHAFT